jgi:hypothetical protein
MSTLAGLQRRSRRGTLPLEDAGEVHVVFDVIGGDILDRSAALVRAGGTLVTTIRVPTVKPEDGRAVFFEVEADRSQLVDLAQRLRDGRLKPIVGPYGRSPKRRLRSPPSGALPERRSPGSLKGASKDEMGVPVVPPDGRQIWQARAATGQR